MANLPKRCGSLWLAVSSRGILVGSSSVSGQGLLTLKGHRGPVFDLAFSPDGKQLASASEDRTVSVWDVSTGRVVLTLRGHWGEVTAVAFSPDGKRIATGSAGLDGTLRIWDARSGKKELTIPVRDQVERVAFLPNGKRGHAGRVMGVDFSPDGKQIASCDSHGGSTVGVWDTGTGQESFTLTPGAIGLQTVAFSPGGNHIAAGSFDTNVYLWNLNKSE